MACTLKLPRPPFLELESVSLEDEDGAETALTSDDYFLDSTPLVPVLWLKNLDGCFAVIRYRAGYEDAAAVPAMIKRWLLVAINTMYENRESVVTGTIVSEVPRTFVDGCLDPYIVPLG